MHYVDKLRPLTSEGSELDAKGGRDWTRFDSLAGQRGRRPQVLETAPDCAAGDLGRSRRGGYTTAASGDGLRRRVQPTNTLVKPWTDRLVAGADGVLIDHEPTRCSARRVVYPSPTSRHKSIRLYLCVA